MLDLIEEYTSRKVNTWGEIKFYRNICSGRELWAELLASPLSRSSCNCGFGTVGLVWDFRVANVPGIIRIAFTCLLRVIRVFLETFEQTCYRVLHHISNPFFWTVSAGSFDTFFTDLLQFRRIIAICDLAVFITSAGMAGSKIHLLFYQRANSRNRNRKPNYGRSPGAFAYEGMGFMQAALRFVLLIIKIWAQLREKVMPIPVPRQPSAIRFQCIVIVNYLTTGRHRKVMKLSSEGRCRGFILH